ncbi:hypothetical protein JXJ21_01720, partial [candidate division KSB1 bacterium]|nr:hypothetical protein [candidate division KSB1 bacterium]
RNALMNGRSQAGAKFKLKKYIRRKKQIVKLKMIEDGNFYVCRADLMMRWRLNGLAMRDF